MMMIEKQDGEERIIRSVLMQQKTHIHITSKWSNTDVVSAFLFSVSMDVYKQNILSKWNTVT